MVKKSLASKGKCSKAYAKMKEINNIDEVKQTYYESFLKLLYPIDGN